MGISQSPKKIIELLLTRLACIPFIVTTVAGVNTLLLLLCRENSCRFFCVLMRILTLFPLESLLCIFLAGAVIGLAVDFTTMFTGGGGGQLSQELLDVELWREGFGWRNKKKLVISLTRLSLLLPSFCLEVSILCKIYFLRTCEADDNIFNRFNC